MVRLVLDTNIIGDIEELGIDPHRLEETEDEYLVTHIQEDEIMEIGDEDFRDEILEILDVIVHEKIATSDFILGHSKLGRARLGGSVPLSRIRDELSDDGGNDTRDALIAATAITNDYTLVTNDGELQSAMERIYPGNLMTGEKFFQDLTD